MSYRGNVIEVLPGIAVIYVVVYHTQGNLAATFVMPGDASALLQLWSPSME